MNIEQLKAALKPALNKITLSNGIELYAHRPTIADLEKCTTPKGTLIHCICDETGYHVFSDGADAGKIDINTEIDTVVANELFEKAMLLWGNDTTQDEIEKK